MTENQGETEGEQKVTVESGEEKEGTICKIPFKY